MEQSDEDTLFYLKGSADLLMKLSEINVITG